MVSRLDPLILAIDQGSSATKVLAIDQHGRIVSRVSVAVATHSPEPGAVEQDPSQVWHSVEDAIARCAATIDPRSVRAVGISSQRESVVVWDRSSGHPVTPLISWQDRRGQRVCDEIVAAGRSEAVSQVTGLPVDAAFSAAKLSWLLDRVDPDRAKSLCAGTVDSWLLHRFGCGHVTEIGNASRTQLLDIHEGIWDQATAELFGVPQSALPALRPSGHHFGLTLVDGAVDPVPIAAVMADSHAALFAQRGWQPGVVKVTLGTGSSMMRLATGTTHSDGLALTIAWDIGEIVRAIEGNVLACGSTLVWLSSILGCELEELLDLASTAASEGVHLVPAFNGLGAPYWDPTARGTIAGLTLATSRATLARAGLESIAFQVADVVEEVERVEPVTVIRVDGGPSRNGVLMQLLADTTGLRVEASVDSNLSAMGAAYLAGISIGLWGVEDIDSLQTRVVVHEPRESTADRRDRRAAWARAVDRARSSR